MIPVSHGVVVVMFLIMASVILSRTESKSGWITVATRFFALVLAAVGFGVFLDVIHVIDARPVLVTTWCVASALYAALIKALYRGDRLIGSLCFVLCLSLTMWSLRALHLL